MKMSRAEEPAPSFLVALAARIVATWVGTSRARPI